MADGKVNIGIDELREMLLPNGAREKSKGDDAVRGFFSRMTLRTGNDVRSRVSPGVEQKSSSVQDSGLGGAQPPLNCGPAAQVQEVANQFSPDWESFHAGQLAPRSPIEANQGGGFDPTAMVGEIFEAVEPFHTEMLQVVKVLEPIAQLKQLHEALDPIQIFAEKLATVADSLGNLEPEVKRLAHLCEPIGMFYDQVVATNCAFKSKTVELIRTLERLSLLRMRLIEVADAFGPVSKLHDDFSGVFEVFLKNPDKSEEDTDLVSMVIAADGAFVN
ncbi:MAG: hypothetical protein IVW54_20530 [Candidatus Binataceae bacterium]|nr:hypothetical protein [Candidatus Binataceae bacterium]